MLDDLIRDSRDPYVRWSASNSRGVVLRARGDDRGAEAAFAKAVEEGRYWEWYDRSLFNWITVAALRDAAEARSAVDRMRRPRTRHALYGAVFPLLIAGDLERAAEEMGRKLPEFRTRSWPAGEGLLLLSLLKLVTGERKDAEALLREVASGTDPREAEIARFYLGGRDRLHYERVLGRVSLSGTWVSRTVLQYLEGVRLDRDGDTEGAARCFRMAADADPSRYWPSVLARRKLDSPDDAAGGSGLT
jgi:hypothetical protein